MDRRITDEDKERIRELMQKGLNASNIARELGLKYQTAYFYVKTFELRFPSLGEYFNYLAREKGFGSYSEYQEHLAKQRTNPETREKFKSITEYQKHLVKQRGYASFLEYQEEFAKRKSFSSISKYNRHMAEQRQQKPEYKELINLIKSKLKELGKSQNWLAKELCITKQAVSQYVHGESFPKEEIQEKLDRILLMSKDNLEGRVE